MPSYLVLVNAAGDDASWAAYDDAGGKGVEAQPFEAPSPDAAITRVRDAHAELKGAQLRGAHYTTVSPDRIKRMRRRLIESFELGRAADPDDEPRQGTLT